MFGKAFKILMGIVNDRVQTIYKDGHPRRVVITAGAHVQTDGKAKYAGGEVVWLRHPEDNGSENAGRRGINIREREKGTHRGGFAEMPTRARAQVVVHKDLL